MVHRRQQQSALARGDIREYLEENADPDGNLWCRQTCGNKNCRGYTSYRINIWGLKEPETNRAVGRPIMDQQVTNIIRHLETSHGVPREDITWAHLPQKQPPFPDVERLQDIIRNLRRENGHLKAKVRQLNFALSLLSGQGDESDESEEETRENHLEEEEESYLGEEDSWDDIGEGEEESRLGEEDSWDDVGEGEEESRLGEEDSWDDSGEGEEDESWDESWKESGGEGEELWEEESEMNDPSSSSQESWLQWEDEMMCLKQI